MAKFNMNRIRGLSDEKSAEDKKATIGQGLLNEASKAMKADIMRVKYIPIDQIQRNSGNFYTIGDIMELKLSIEKIGLKQPLVVHQQVDGSYLLLGGERRLTAVEELVKEGKWTDPVVPCVLQDYDRVDLPIGDDMKELYCIITTNREQRDYTDADLANEIRNLKAIYAALREAGVESLTLGYDENGNEITRPLKAKRTRELIAEDLKVSTGKIAAFDKVENNGSEEVKEALQENKISIMKASKIADLPEEEQGEALREELENAADQPVTPSEEKEKQMVPLSAEEIRRSLEELMEKAEAFTDTEVTDKEYRKFSSSVLTVRRLLEKHSK